MPKFTDEPLLGKDFNRAFLFASKMHAKQIRKAVGEPYISHLMEVVALVLQTGKATETVAIAALLHDVVEDTNATSEQVRTLFGKAVTDIVDQLTEDKSLPKEERKDAYVQKLNSSWAAVIVVALADKLANLRSYYSQSPHLFGASQKAFYEKLIPVFRTWVPALGEVAIAQLRELEDLFEKLTH